MHFVKTFFLLVFVALSFASLPACSDSYSPESIDEMSATQLLEAGRAIKEEYGKLIHEAVRDAKSRRAVILLVKERKREIEPLRIKFYDRAYAVGKVALNDVLGAHVEDCGGRSIWCGMHPYVVEFPGEKERAKIRTGPTWDRNRDTEPYDFGIMLYGMELIFAGFEDEVMGSPEDVSEANRKKIRKVYGENNIGQGAIFEPVS